MVNLLKGSGYTSIKDAPLFEIAGFAQPKLLITSKTQNKQIVVSGTLRDGQGAAFLEFNLPIF